MRKIIIDCDPGQDDAVMLLLALASPDEFDILGITAVAGNVPLALTQRNARLVCDVAGCHDVPVFAGSDRPLIRDLFTAENIHGRTGVDGMTIREPDLPLQDQDGVAFLIQTLRAAEDNEVTLVPTGPLTNIGRVLRDAPDVLPKIREIVLMGGAWREGGNCTPSAEFNIYVDPHAADVVLRCGRPLVMAPLDVTHQALVNRRFLSQLRELDTTVARETLGMLEFFNRFDMERYGSEGAPLHDPCTIAWLLQPELFVGKHCNVTVETESKLTMGHTAADFWGVTGREPNALWLHEINAEGFFDLLLNRLERLP